MAPVFYQALIDTGASCTCITSKVVSDAKLTPIGKQNIGGVHATQAVNQYQFQVGIPFGQNSLSPTGVTNVRMGFIPVVGVEFSAGTSFDLLIGRDIICQGTFTMSFDGHAMFCI